MSQFFFYLVEIVTGLVTFLRMDQIASVTTMEIPPLWVTDEVEQLLLEAAEKTGKSHSQYYLSKDVLNKSRASSW